MPELKTTPMIEDKLLQVVPHCMLPGHSEECLDDSIVTWLCSSIKKDFETVLFVC